MFILVRQVLLMRFDPDGMEVSPLIFLQSPSGEFRSTFWAMAASVSVWKHPTSATVLAPTAAPTANFPREPLPPVCEEDPVT